MVALAPSSKPPLVSPLTSLAKINLSLEVLGRLPNNFHVLRSVVCPISWADRIAFTLLDEPGVSLRCTLGAELAKHIEGLCARSPEERRSVDTLHGTDNLAARAAREFFDRNTDGKVGLAIHIDKRVPFGAGLGGGSSNAATTLRFLRDQLRPDLTDADLQPLAGEIGSDVATLLANRLSIVFGTGKESIALTEPVISAVASVAKGIQLIVVKPPVSSHTKNAYSGLARPVCFTDTPLMTDLLSSRWGRPGLPALLQAASPHSNVQLETISELRRKFVDELFQARNDFQDSVRSGSTEVRDAIRALESAGVENVLLAGSGSCVVGISLRNDESRAVRLREDVRRGLPESFLISECELLPDGLSPLK